MKFKEISHNEKSRLKERLDRKRIRDFGRDKMLRTHGE